VPPKLSAVLAALSAEASSGEFTAVERLLGGSFSGLAEIRRTLGTLAASIGDLWFPAMDDIAAVLPTDSSLVVVVLDHEEIMTFSIVNLADFACQVPAGLAAAGLTQPYVATAAGAALGVAGLRQATRQKARARKSTPAAYLLSINEALAPQTWSTRIMAVMRQATGLSG
jgi:hypothetical protein